MTYTATPSHFYGQGTPDPLRADITLRSLEAKSARLQAVADGLGCACLNLSNDPSRLVFERGTPDDLAARPRVDMAAVDHALALEKRADYSVPSGKYWKEESRFDPTVIDEIDAAWLATIR